MKLFLVIISIWFAFQTVAFAEDVIQLEIIEYGSYKSEYGPPKIDSEGIHIREVKKLVMLDNDIKWTPESRQ